MKIKAQIYPDTVSFPDPMRQEIRKKMESVGQEELISVRKLKGR